MSSISPGPGQRGKRKPKTSRRSRRRRLSHGLPRSWPTNLGFKTKCRWAGNSAIEVSSMKTVLITGCSSGYGLETARYFHAHGRNVIATMRTPREDILPRSARLRVLPLDVTEPRSIAAAIEAFGPVDVLVNNAGIGVIGVFEATRMVMVREVFETNTFGMMAMTQAVLPQLRTRRAGVVVNVTSSVTLAPMPLAAAYTASKMAIERVTRSLAHELEAVNVRGQLVEPGYAPTNRLTRYRRARLERL